MGLYVTVKTVDDDINYIDQSMFLVQNNSLPARQSETLRAVCIYLVSFEISPGGNL